jgi:hypothetical protein
LNILLFPQDIPGTFYKRYEGSIDRKYNIVVNLTRVDSALSGSYYYIGKGELINFIRSSVDSAGNVYLEEDDGYDENYNPKSTGIFKGTFSSPEKISGTWEKPGSGKQLPFYLEEKYPAGTARLKAVHKEKNYSDYGSANIEVTTLELLNPGKPPVADSINKYLQQVPRVGYTEEGSRPAATVDDLLDEFIDMYIEDIVEDSVSHDGYIPRYEYTNTMDVLFNDNYILSVSNMDYSYLGGAHPNTLFIYMSFDLATGKLLTTEDIFKPGFEDKLYKLGEKKFREFYDLDESKDLNEQGFWFENGFKLNGNFYLTKAGINFLFNQYEVGPYALGAPEIYFKYSEIKDLIKEDSIPGKGQSR